MDSIREWRSAAAVYALAAAAPADDYSSDIFLPTRDSSPVIHRRGRFKPNQRKQRRGEK